MKCIRLLLLFVYLCICADASAQLSTNEQPLGFNSKLVLREISKSPTDVAIMPKLDMVKIEAEDKEDEEYDMPPRFGYSHKVNYDLNNSGTWYELQNGDRLWQLNVVCPNALSVNLCYDKFWIPKGGKFFVYSKDKKRAIGAFTNRNNKGDRDHVRGFATGLIYSDDVVLEYYQPKEASSDAIISVEYVVHGYRYINIEEAGFGQSGPCMVNVNCEEGQDWQNEKIAVAMILVNGNRYCSGSLINTTDLDQKPYFLTADHCLGGWANEYIKYDADTLPNLDHYSFYWNYESPGCTNTSIAPPIISTTGATILANNSYSDFALLRLSEDPQYLSNYTPYYLGWDKSGQSGDPGVCIHHPQGDVKKISTVDGTPISSGWNNTNIGSHWRVGWKSTLNGHGMTQGGSSGSPLINDAHRVIGQLHGSNCDNCNNPYGRSFYGKFDVSWTGNSSDNNFRRLSCWLDSLNIGVQTMEALRIITGTLILNADQQLYSNIRITNAGKLIITSEIQLVGNCRLIVESGGQLVIDGGKLSNVNLDLKPGASLRIVFGGVLDTVNDFEAPLGATIDIANGEIL
jgi:hypothetical protein